MDRSEDRVELEAEGVPDHFGASNPDEGMIAPGDLPMAATDTGVTAAEQRFGDSVAERSQREVPDRVSGEDPSRAGRLVEPNTALGEMDSDEPTADAPGDTEAMSAEEAALRFGEERAG